MADTFFSSSKRYPLTLKPITPPANKETHQDIFNLQNTVRSLITDIYNAAAGGFSLLEPVTALSVDLDITHAGKYLRFEGGGTKTYTVVPDVNVDLPVSAEITLRNASAGDLTVVPGAGVTIFPPLSGSYVVPESGNAWLKKVAPNTYDMGV